MATNKETEKDQSNLSAIIVEARLCATQTANQHNVNWRQAHEFLRYIHFIYVYTDNRIDRSRTAYGPFINVAYDFFFCHE